MVYRRYKITTIVGEKDGIGVENLQGSGMIAGETSRAYDEVFTISLVSFWEDNELGFLFVEQTRFSGPSNLFGDPCELKQLVETASWNS